LLIEQHANEQCSAVGVEKRIRVRISGDVQGAHGLVPLI